MATRFSITVPLSFLDELKVFFGEDSENGKIIKSQTGDSWRYSSKTVTSIYIEKLNDEILDKLLELAATSKGVAGNRKLINEIDGYRKIQQNPEGSVVKDLQILKEAMDKYIETTVEHYIFYKDEITGAMIPWVVVNSKYTPEHTSGQSYFPANTEVKIKSVYLGSLSDRSLRYENADIRGKGVTIKELLEQEGYYLENEDLLRTYKDELQEFFRIKEMIGGQFTGIGLGYELNSWRYSRSESTCSLEKDGVSYKLVVDTFPEEKIYRDTTPLRFKGRNEQNNGDIGDNDNTVLIPVQPFVRMFNLQTHSFLNVHVNSLTQYIYDVNLGNKLILPEEHKNLIDILARGLSEDMSDIIKGKTGGVIVIATGKPGTGKTLTAEVYSEVVQKPLYIVQASQLGIELKDLEEKLIEVLNRATRWGAILLIDEADVYIHERGSDIRQNAIVGIFLRVLEYYRGILFLTSNRGDVIDDAIMSRKTAHIQYEMPTEENQMKIWRVLADEYRVDMTDKLIKEVVETFPNLSGRDIKNHLKLGKLLALKMEKPVDLQLFTYIHKYLVIDK